MRTSIPVAGAIARSIFPVLIAGFLQVAGSATAEPAPSLSELHSAPTNKSDETQTHAAPREVKRVGYQKFASINCNGENKECALVFLTVRENRRLEITNVSCATQALGAPVLFRLSTSEIADYLTLRPTAAGFSTVNAETKLVAEANQQLAFILNADADVLAIYCKVAGEMVYLEQP